MTREYGLGEVSSQESLCRIKLISAYDMCMLQESASVVLEIFFYAAATKFWCKFVDLNFETCAFLSPL